MGRWDGMRAIGKVGGKCVLLAPHAKRCTRETWHDGAGPRHSRAVAGVLVGRSFLWIVGQQDPTSLLPSIRVVTMGVLLRAGAAYPGVNAARSIVRVT